MLKAVLNGNAFERTFSTERWLNYPLECVTTRRVFLFRETRNELDQLGIEIVSA
jgi:hypothetical protein